MTTKLAIPSFAVLPLYPATAGAQPATADLSPTHVDPLLSAGWPNCGLAIAPPGELGPHIAQSCYGFFARGREDEVQATSLGHRSAQGAIFQAQSRTSQTLPTGGQVWVARPVAALLQSQALSP